MKRPIAGSHPSPEGLLLAIDVGTTELKVAVVSVRGGPCKALGARRLPVLSPEPGAREQDPLALLQALVSVIAGLRRALGADWKRIEGIGLAAQGGSAILMDRETGQAATAMQLWSDMRPMARLAEIAAVKPVAYWQKLSGLDNPGAGLARLLWLRDRHPKMFQGSHLYGGIGELVFFQLTGVWRQDSGNAIQQGCYSIGPERLVPGPLALAGVPLSFVAPLRQGHETHRLSDHGARLLGLAAGIPVAGPYIDHEAGYLSAAATGGRPLQCSLGTAWVGNFVVDGRPPASIGLDLILPSPTASGSLILRVLPAGNVSWEWALTTFLDPRLDRAIRRSDAVFRERLLAHAGLVARPWLTFPHPETPGIAGHGAFTGIAPNTTGHDLLRAMTAGLACEFGRLFTALPSGVVDRVVLGGGASRGWWFRELLAALFAPLPVFMNDPTEPAGLRGALYAFSRKAAQAPQLRVKRPTATCISEVKQLYDYADNIRRSS